MTNLDHVAIRPVSPAAPYVGGKRLLAREIIARIGAVPHHCYAEPFVGMGGVFLRRPAAAPSEVINDISRDVFTFFRVIQEHFAYFTDYLRFRLASRAEFERLSAVDPATLTDIQRAARFLYLQRTAFGGKVAGQRQPVQHHPGGALARGSPRTAGRSGGRMPALCRVHPAL